MFGVWSLFPLAGLLIPEDRWAFLAASSGALVIVVLARRHRLPVLTPRSFSLFLLGLLCTAALAIGLLEFARLAAVPFSWVGEPYARLLSTDAPVRDPLWLLTILVMAPLFEEILYRERILLSLPQSWHASGRVLLTSALWAISHISPVQMFVPFISGIALGTLMLRTRSLALCVGAHVGINTVAALRPSWAFVAAGCLACGTAPTVMEPFEVPQTLEADRTNGAPEDPEAGDYLHQVAVRDSVSDTYLLHWPERKMPLAIYLPPPPEGLFPDPERTHAEVRRGVLDWTDVAAPGLPSFRFVESHGEADIPIIWAEEPTGDWYIAYCSVQVNLRQKRLDVEQVLVTGRWGDGHVAEPSEIYETVLHEMGHALGLLGHSDDPGDIMCPGSSRVAGKGLSARDSNTLRELYAGPNRQIRGRRGKRR